MNIYCHPLRLESECSSGFPVNSNIGDIYVKFQYGLNLHAHFLHMTDIFTERHLLLQFPVGPKENAPFSETPFCMTTHGLCGAPEFLFTPTIHYAPCW